MTLLDLLMSLKMANSKRRAMRLINQGLVYLDGVRVYDLIEISGTHALRVGTTSTMTVEIPKQEN